MLMPEYITAENDYGDAWKCLCGNTSSGDGFFPCTPDGVEVEPTEELWDGVHYVCASCRRVVDQNTLEITKRPNI